jgi:HlyD family secretion protein
MIIIATEYKNIRMYNNDSRKEQLSLSVKKANFVKLNIRWIIIAVILLIGIGGAITYSYLKTSNQSELPSGITTDKIHRETIIGKVGSTGKVRANQISELTWKTSGTVDKVLVKELDSVKTGDKLVSLDQNSIQASILKAIQDFPAAKRNLGDLLVSDLKRTQAQQDLAVAKKDYQTALDNRKIKEGRNTSDTNLMVAEATYLTAKSNLESIEKFFSFMQDKPEDDLARAQATAQLSMARKNYDWAVWNYQWAQSKPLPEDVRIAEAELNVAWSKMADAERNWEKVKDKPDPDDLTAARAKVDALQAQMDLTTITAPFEATISDVAVQPGDLVKSGSPAVQLVDLSHLYLDISISEVDINRVKIGQDIQITFDAIQDKVFEGLVTEISEIGIPNQEVIYFTVTCEIKNPDSTIKPGMTAAATIAVEKADNVLTVPNRAVQTDGKSRFVTVVRNQALVKVPLELGMISDEHSEIKSGDLKEGEVVVTNPQSLPTQGALK